MGPMLSTLFTNPQKGFLHAEHFWNFSGPVLIQYWRFFKDLENFAHQPSNPHLKAWKCFNQAVGADGIWHETYTINPDQFECVYGNIPRFGLAAAADHIQAVGRRDTVCKRLGYKNTYHPVTESS